MVINLHVYLSSSFTSDKFLVDPLGFGWHLSCRLCAFVVLTGQVEGNVFFTKLRYQESFEGI